MKSRAATKAEKQWMDRITQLGCVVCMNVHEVFSPATPHHMDGRTKPDCHYKTIPLCFQHHQANRNDAECASRHYYKAEFEKRYGTEQELLEQCQRLLS